MATNSYDVRFTDPASGSLQVTDETFNDETDLTFVGRNKPRYAQYIAENFLHLLENFASEAMPIKPITGQLWFNTTTGINELQVYNGSEFIPTGSIKKASTEPSGQRGDLWSDTENQQLKIFSGSSWQVIGPQFSDGLLTGPKPESMIADDDTTRSILSLYANNNRIAIMSDSQFTPKVVTVGFPVIGRGLTLSNETTDTENKLWGTAYSADNLNYEGTVVSATNFLRSDKNSEISGSLRVSSNDGITIGKDSSFGISSSVSAISLTSFANKNINFAFGNPTESPISGLFIKKTNNSPFVGIGNNLNPQKELDVVGDVLISGSLHIDGTTESTSIGSGSIVTNGGLSVAKQSNFGSFAKFANTITLSKDTSGSVLLPLATEFPIYDIGSPAQPFRNIFGMSIGSADSIIPNSSIPKSQFYGVFNGTLAGNVNGSAASLTQTVAFSLNGDITCASVNFNGTAPVVLETKVSAEFFTSKPASATALDGDQLLIFRNKTGFGIQTITKEKFLSSVPVVPIGSIFPFAGTIVPSGYLFCDGSELVIKTYKRLFDIIGYSYRNRTLLLGVSTFALPDLRGRFPLGKDDMDNEMTIPLESGSTATAGGNRNGVGVNGTLPANRVHDLAASTLGYGAGNEAIGQLASVSATGSKATVTPVSTNEQASSIMNPYQTINYIIFTGVI